MAREMKDSGVAWIGAVPDSWNINSLSQLFVHVKNKNSNLQEANLLSLSYGKIKRRNIESSAGLLPESFDGYNIIEKDDIVLRLTDLQNDQTSLRVGLAEERGIITSAYLTIRKQAEISAQYFFYYLYSFDISKGFYGMGGGVRQGLNWDGVKWLKVLVPPFDEQERIASYLSQRCTEIDAVLEKTRASIEEYKNLKQAIITQAVTKGVRGDRLMKESGIIWLDATPEDWKISKIKYAIFPHEKPVLPTDDVITCFRDGTVTLRKNRREEGFTVSFTENGYQGVDVGDLVIHGMDTFAGAIGCSDSRGKASPVVHVCSTIGNNRYFMYFLRYMAYSNVLMDFSNGVRIRSSDFRNFKKLAVFEMLVPSLEEQNEIVNYLDSTLAKIERVINQKESLLDELESYKKAVIYEYVTGKKEVPSEGEYQVYEAIVYPYFPAALQSKKPRFAQAVLMSKVLDVCRIKMGRVKLEKMMFVLENSIGFNFETEYVREAAGPLDKSIYACEKIISKKNNWFSIRKSSYGVSYQPTKDTIKYKKYYDKYFADYANEIDHIIDAFRDFNADQAEIIATLYGAWNDFIIDKKSYTDDDIVEEVLNNWNDTKKRFSKDVWLRAIQRMRELDLVPHGYGRHTIIKQN